MMMADGLHKTISTNFFSKPDVVIIGFFSFLNQRLKPKKIQLL